jgi:dimethylaniline monooxygenase (N-oxide forming)
LKQVGLEARISHNLYKHAIHPLTGDSLVFIGFVRPTFGAVPPLAEMQARWFALLCSNKLQLPDTMIMINRIRSYVRYITHLFTPFRTNRITTLTDFLSFSDDMARDIGCRPNLGLTMLLHDPHQWLRCMIGPISNVQYRLCGPHANPEQARHRLLITKWKPLWYNFFELTLLYISTLLWFFGIRRCQPHASCPIHERNI